MRLKSSALVLILLCATGTLAQASKCISKLAELPDAPELLGFHMGMTAAQVKARVPQLALRGADDFGVIKTSISPDFDPLIDKTTLGGVRTVSFDFLDDRLTSLWLGYDGSFKWLTVPDFVKGISQSLRLPAAWTEWKVRGEQLRCADFQMTVSIVAEAPSFHIVDETAEKTIAERREAKEEQDAAIEAAETVEIVGDKKARVYYIEACRPATEIKEADRVIFKTSEDAEKAGYKLAKSCE